MAAKKVNASPARVSLYHGKRKLKPAGAYFRQKPGKKFEIKMVLAPTEKEKDKNKNTHKQGGGGGGNKGGKIGSYTHTVTFEGPDGHKITHKVGY